MNGLNAYHILQIYRENNKIRKEGYLFYIRKKNNVKDKIYVQLDYENGIRIYDKKYYEYNKPIKIIANLEDYKVSLSHITAYENVFILLGQNDENLHLFQCNSKEETLKWIHEILIIQTKKKDKKYDFFFTKTSCTMLDNISLCIIT